jgi:prephenate dehydrogenase
MTDQPGQAWPAEQTVAIVGVGLIGGSIARALKWRRAASTVIGVGRDAARLEEPRKKGWLDRITTRMEDAAREADLIVFCTPVDRIVNGVREAAASCRSGTLLTDAGSVKGPICAALEGTLPAGVEFVGAHPLAGSEKKGCEFAHPELFVERVCVVTPCDTTSNGARSRVTVFWQMLGMRVIEMTPAAHDRALAETSHLPHLIAATLAATLSPENRELAATGFRDTTRIAVGDPELWTAILLSNADEVLRSLAKFEQSAIQFRRALEARDSQRLQDLLTAAKLNRGEIQ